MIDRLASFWNIRVLKCSVTLARLLRGCLTGCKYFTRCTNMWTRGTVVSAAVVTISEIIIQLSYFTFAKTSVPCCVPRPKTPFFGYVKNKMSMFHEFFVFVRQRAISVVCVTFCSEIGIQAWHYRTLIKRADISTPCI